MAEHLQTLAAGLLSRFRRQRPLRGGSLLVTIFGDAIAPRGGAITLGSMIELAAPFGLNERLTRTAMARLAADGWLDSRSSGRRSEYRLSRVGRGRFLAATRQIYSVPGLPWTGTWTMVVLPAASQSGRQAARNALSWAGFGEPTTGLLVHPTLTAAEAGRMVRGSTELAGAVILTTGAAPADSHRRLAAASWHPGELAGRYRQFIRRFEPALRAVRGRQRPQALASFVVRTLLIHEYRRIHLRDPMLPPELLPADWVGADAYRLCRGIYARIAGPAERYIDTTAATFAGRLPSAGVELYGRFGGLSVLRSAAAGATPRPRR